MAIGGGGRGAEGVIVPRAQRVKKASSYPGRSLPERYYFFDLRDILT
jgi:hypothetical protein